MLAPSVSLTNLCDLPATNQEISQFLSAIGSYPAPTGGMESSGAPGPADQSNVLHAISSLGLADLITTRDAMWDEYETNVHGYPMDNIVELDERILTLCSVGHPDRVDACERLSTSLRKSSPSTSSLTVSDTDGDDSSHEHLDVLRMTRDALLVEYQETTDMDTLDQTIDLGEQVLALCTSKNLDRAAACSDLAHSLRLRSQQKTRADGVETTIDHTLEPIATLPPDVIMLLWQSYEESGDPELFKQVIDAKTVVLNSFPEQDPRRVRACTDLADTLFQQYPLTGDDAVLNQVISLYSEARALCPSEHDDRVIICVQLAIHQYQLHKHTGDVNPLNEAIALEREALALCPLGHRNRVALCDNLASSLYLLYHRTGDVDSLIEAMKLEREVLASRSAGHPDRASACVSLAASLDERYGQTGDGAMLNEAIELLREALGLCRSGDQSLRASSCSSLARCLKGRYEQTGDISLLDEAIDLGREAVSLRPSGHPDRSPPCSDLAFSLKAKYERAGDVDLLIEAIELEREILVLHPPGDPTRAGSCGNLAYSHKRLYEHTGAEYLIIEATKLEREALALHPRGHLNYAASCDSLADILRTHYERTGDTSLCNEAIQLSLTGSECAPRPVAWRSLALLSLLYLSQRTRSESALPTALKYLQELSHCEPGDIRFYMSSVHMLLGRFWACHADWTPEVSSAVASVYPDIIDKLPLMATFVLNTSSRLLALRSFSQLGSQACVVSLQAGRLPQAVELLDQAHGIIWAQALRQRDPQLSDVPPELASDLAMLLRAMTVPASSSTAERHLTLQDVRHENNSRIKELQSEIRRIQGLERFMRGSTFETLRQVARDHPVVVLVGVDTESYGVIISDAAQEEPQLVKLSITSRRILQLRGYTQRAGARQRAAAEDGWRDAWTEPVESPGGLQDLGRYMRPRDQSHSLSGVLKELWEGIVKPVLALLGLKVS
jgi:tetratricopeptide (TPR) repeat protein